MTIPSLPEAIPDLWRRELNLTLAVAVEAAAEARRHYAAFEAIPNAPANISTEADKALQDLILARLASHFPDDAFLAEEGTAQLHQLKRTGPRRWVIDPIDGTRGFARKNGEFSVMIGLVHHGRCVVGAVAEPVAGQVTFAARGGGCWHLHGETLSRCRVGDATRMDAATVIVSRDEASRRDRRWANAAGYRHSYSSGLKLAMVARGEADLYWREHAFHSWDLCAGHILVEEAGGTVTDAAGRPIDYANLPGEEVAGILASNGKLPLPT